MAVTGVQIISCIGAEMGKTPEEYEAEIVRLKAGLDQCLVVIDEAKEKAEKRIADLERSANSARELARIAMTHTGTRAMRVEVLSSESGISVIVCDPAGDEAVTAKRMAKMLDATIWARIGEFTDEEPKPVGAVG